MGTRALRDVAKLWVQEVGVAMVPGLAGGRRGGNSVALIHYPSPPAPSFQSCGPFGSGFVNSILRRDQT